LHSPRVADGVDRQGFIITGIVFPIDAIPIRSVHFVLIFIDLRSLLPSLAFGGVPIISLLLLIFQTPTAGPSQTGPMMIIGITPFSFFIGQKLVKGAGRREQGEVIVMPAGIDDNGRVPGKVK
jgi:hypothetical protein